MDHLKETVRHIANLRFFPGAVAALVTEADRRGAEWIEVQFRMDGQLCIRDDGRAFTEREQQLLAAIGTGKPVPDLDGWDVYTLLGFLVHSPTADFYTWPILGDRLAAKLHLITPNPVWEHTSIPHAPNTPPPHGVEIRWARAPAPIDGFYLLQRETAAFLTPQAAAKVHLRTPGLRGHRPLNP